VADFSTTDMTGDQEEIRRADNLPSDFAQPDVPQDEPAAPPAEATLSDSAQGGEGPLVKFIQDASEPGQVVVTVVAANLGEVAGLAFTLAYDDQELELLDQLNALDLEGSSSYAQTRFIFKPMGPGLVSFGVARFCTGKSPWGPSDQCGGVKLNDESPIASFKFRLLASSGTTPLSFKQGTTLIRRPNREAVRAHFVNAVLAIQEVTP